MDKEREPGTARFGNFINYYSFNPPEKRLDLLPPTQALLQKLKSSRAADTLADTHTDPLFVLDVGCNAGDLTVAAYERLTGTGTEAAKKNTDLTKDIPQGEDCKPNIKILGVDLDARLVERCTENNPHPQQIDFKVADLLRDTDRAGVIDTYLENGQTSCFDLTMCFSVTLWIHLNHGDLGLQSFLSYLASHSQYLLIEPQPWKCYRTAVRRMKRSKCEPFKHFDSLIWRENVDDDILSYLRWECGMEVVEQYGRTDWDRKDLTVAAYERLTGTGTEAAKKNTDLTKDIPQGEDCKPNIKILGVDLDARLVERCTANNPHPQQIDFKVADLLRDTDRAGVIDTYLENGQTSCFDLTMCFSVTLWIHLNHGDLGLQSFLSYLASHSQYLLIEPQPWKCYRTAVRRMKRSKCEPFKHFDSLIWRENVDDDILSYLRWECGMEVVEQYGRTDWDRKVCLLKNTNMM